MRGQEFSMETRQTRTRAAARRNKALGLVAIVAAGGLLALAGCEKGDASSMKLPERPPAMVTVAPAITRDVPVYIDQIGRTVPVQTVAVVPQVGGRIMATHVEHGDYVKKGQLLFEIDPRPFQATLDAAVASLAQSRAELELARAELSRVSEALQSAAVSKLEYDQKKSGVAMGEARVAAAEAAIDSAKLDLEFSRIHSPLDGKAGARLVDAGNIVKANDAPLIRIQQMTPIFAEFTISENDLGTVRSFLTAKGLDLPDTAEQGLTALVDIPADSARVLGALGIPSAASQPFASAATQPAETMAASATGPAGIRRGPREGTLTFLDNAVDNTTGTVKLRVTLANQDRYFWPGQFVNIRLILTRKDGAVLVPAAAQQIGQQGPFVYVVNKDGVAEIRPITPGQRQGDMLVVDKGVEPGEEVITTGHRMVMPGNPVMVTNRNSGQGPAGPTPPHAAARK